MPFIANPEYINQLSIADSLKAYVDHALLTSFSKDMSPQGQEDVLASLLLAQLAADKKYDRFHDNNSWVREFQNIAGMIGWVVQSNGPYQVPAKAGTKLCNVIADAVPDCPREVMDALSNSDNSDPARILTNMTTSPGKFNILIGVCKEAQGNPEIELNSFDGATSRPGNCVLESEVNGSPITHTTLPMTLNHYVYATVREAVKQKLGDNYQANVSEVQL